jgi:hypothetical protein
MTEAHLFALGIALAALSGVRAYLTVLGVGLAGLMGWVDLPPALAATMSPWVMVTAGALTAIEFTADKIPGVDSGWDLLQTLLRIPVGAFLAAAALSPDGQLGTGALIAGGGVAFATHALKTGTRAVINASPEPVSNWTASLGEDIATTASLGLVFAHPWIALGLVSVVIGGTAALVFWLARKALRGFSRLARAG